jgi:hypothetical protein
MKCCSCIKNLGLMIRTFQKILAPGPSPLRITYALSPILFCRVTAICNANGAQLSTSNTCEIQVVSHSPHIDQHIIIMCVWFMMVGTLIYLPLLQIRSKIKRFPRVITRRISSTTFIDALVCSKLCTQGGPIATQTDYKARLQNERHWFSAWPHVDYFDVRLEEDVYFPIKNDWWVLASVYLIGHRFHSCIMTLLVWFAMWKIHLPICRINATPRNWTELNWTYSFL